MVDKKVLRKVYLEKRLVLSKEEYERRNHLLQKNVLQHVDFSQYNWLHTFLPIVSKKEVNTWSLIHLARDINPSIQIVVSRTLMNGELKNFLLAEDTRITVNKFGIPEPVDGEEIAIDDIDLVLVPMISFDLEGHRIGYGKGYYDRFLKKIPSARKVGLSLSPPLDKIQFSDRMDVKLTECISPFRHYQFKK